MLANRPWESEKCLGWRERSEPRLHLDGRQSIRCQGEITVMQCLHLPLQRGRVAAVVDHIVGVIETLLPAPLRSKQGVDLLGRQMITRSHPRALGFDGHVDHQYAIDQTALIRFEQQWNHQQHIGRGLRCGAFRHDGMDARMQDGFEPFAFDGGVEDAGAQPGAVEASLCIEHLGAERGDDVRKCGLSRLHQFARDRIGIDHRHAARREQIRDRGFSGTDTACEADAQHGGSLRLNRQEAKNEYWNRQGAKND